MLELFELSLELPYAVGRSFHLSRDPLLGFARFAARSLLNDLRSRGQLAHLTSVKHDSTHIEHLLGSILDLALDSELVHDALHLKQVSLRVRRS